MCSNSDSVVSKIMKNKKPLKIFRGFFMFKKLRMDI